MMKKVFSVLIAAVLLLTLCAPCALAAGGRHCGRADRAACGHACPAYGACQNGWVDEDGDGICDNCRTAQCGNPVNQNRPCKNLRAGKANTAAGFQTAQNCPNNGICAFCGENCGGRCTGSGNRGGNGCGARQGGHHGGRGRHCA